DHIIEQRFRVIDSDGRQFRIENFRSAEARPSAISRVFSATIFNVKRFKVAFELRPIEKLSRDQLLAQLRDRDWTMPTGVGSSASFAELFRAYRADRYRTYGSARDQMPEDEIVRLIGPAHP